MKKVVSIIIMLSFDFLLVVGCTQVKNTDEKPEPEDPIEYIPNDRMETLRYEKEIDLYESYEKLYSFITTEYKEKNDVSFLMLYPENKQRHPHHQYFFTYSSKEDGIYVNPSTYEYFLTLFTGNIRHFESTVFFDFVRTKNAYSFDYSRNSRTFQTTNKSAQCSHGFVECVGRIIPGSQ